MTTKEINGPAVSEPADTPEPSLDGLLAGITPDNLHEEVDLGRPVGMETL